MPKKTPLNLSRRERQILEILYRLGRASAADVMAQMSDAPTYTTVRGLLRILEKKGHIRHEEAGVRYLYSPVMPKTSAGASVLAHVVRTFFNGSPSDAMAALLGSASSVSDDELQRLTRLVQQARKERG
jgi:BlaI family transcriptional regulator, penicillinase repressor